MYEVSSLPYYNINFNNFCVALNLLHEMQVYYPVLLAEVKICDLVQLHIPIVPVLRECLLQQTMLSVKDFTFVEKFRQKVKKSRPGNTIKFRNRVVIFRLEGHYPKCQAPSFLGGPGYVPPENFESLSFQNFQKCV